MMACQNVSFKEEEKPEIPENKLRPRPESTRNAIHRRHQVGIKLGWPWWEVPALPLDETKRLAFHDTASFFDQKFYFFVGLLGALYITCSSSTGGIHGSFVCLFVSLCTCMLFLCLSKKKSPKPTPEKSKTSQKTYRYNHVNDWPNFHYYNC